MAKPAFPNELSGAESSLSQTPRVRHDSIRPVLSFQRTILPAFKAAFAMCDVRAAWCATRIWAFGVFRLLMQSIQFCRWDTVPSPLDRTKISGSGVFDPGA